MRSYRLKLQIEYTKCDECGTCISVCTGNALILTEKLAVDQQRCIACAKCVRVCPFAALSLRD
ncbi:MAG: 4Fe-4S binding protein [Chitinispirillaceae bacterium]